MGSVAGVRGVLVAWAIGLLAVSPPQEPQPALPLSTLPLRLTGVMVDKEAPSRSACLIRCIDPPTRGMFVAGQSVCDLAAIREIRRDGVVIENLMTNRAELLAFPDRTAPAGAPMTAPATVAAPAAAASGTSAAAPAPPVSSDVVTVDLPSGSIARYLASVPALLDSALATPRYRDTANGQPSIDGYEISHMREDSLLNELGLRNGDVVLEVNGQRLDGMATVLRLFGLLQTMSQAKATVLRNGQKLTFVINAR